MKKVLLMLAALAIASPALGGPGVDLTANGLCSGGGGGADGGNLNCPALAAAGQSVRLLAVMRIAEQWIDDSGNDGFGLLAGVDSHLAVQVVGGDVTTDAGFWNDSPGGCRLTSPASAVIFDNTCGASAGDQPCVLAGCTSAKRAFDASQTQVTRPDNSHVEWFIASPGGGAHANGVSDLIFVWEAKWAATKSSSCAGCEKPVFFTVDATPAAQGGQAGAKQDHGTGDHPGVTNQACFNNGCAAVPVRARTWGQLKSLYRH